MAKVFEAGDFRPIAWLSGVQIIDDFGSGVKVNQVQIEPVAHGIDEADQILVLLRSAIEIALLINKPGDRSVGAELGAQLLSAQSRGANKVRPPMVVRIGLVVLPLIERRATHNDDPLTGRRGGRFRSERQDRQRTNEEKAFHQLKQESTTYAGAENAQVVEIWTESTESDKIGEIIN